MSDLGNGFFLKVMRQLLKNASNTPFRAANNASKTSFSSSLTVLPSVFFISVIKTTRNPAESWLSVQFRNLGSRSHLKNLAVKYAVGNCSHLSVVFCYLTPTVWAGGWKEESKRLQSLSATLGPLGFFLSSWPIQVDAGGAALENSQGSAKTTAHSTVKLT